jgi:plasmid stability protein
MGHLIVHDLDDALVVALKRRAARHGRSAEAEHRAILLEVLTDKSDAPGFKDMLSSMPDVGSDEDFLRQRDVPRPVDR